MTSDFTLARALLRTHSATVHKRAPALYEILVGTKTNGQGGLAGVVDASGSTCSASNNVNPTDRALQQWVDLPPKLAGHPILDAIACMLTQLFF
jgi:hypothetical protein